MPANLENLAVATELEKVSFLSSPEEGKCKRVFKLLHNCTHFTWYKVIFKILQERLQQFMKRELSDVQVGPRKGKGTRDQIANIHWIIDKARRFQKTSTLTLLTMLKSLTVSTKTNYGKFLKRWIY